ncbi:site-specific DNA-methyltransferase [Salegentibacter sp. BDJ18]|uniref:site-specific DNA-methyltransferase n=1 Tax=Salegentibacter sp. BDJ18 TaxID=2816376 RepID=UPI001AAFF07F|nr:site-specific DNA-methyltransferase [Salegentibacter sp. BDJ18]MBO2546010.1 site-specific DNA-methyltransferase [Salegentibacter sp. BDJ18]
MSIELITAEEPESKSKDLMQENIEKLKELFPEIVTEGKIDFKALQEVLGEEVEEGEEYYRFTWAGKAQARREAHKPSTGTLRPAKEESEDWDKTQNLYIEGDNLEVLKLMQKSYAGKIKMIYIDPPYNTGKDFVYKDNYKDNLQNYREVTGQVDSDGNRVSTNSDSEGRYHSNWLNMIYPRLKLARNLLQEDGVIFMSIDDNEVENLKKLGNEIFGEENFVSTISISTGANQAGEGVQIQKNIEYCIVFAKNYSNLDIIRVDKTEESYRNLNDAPTPLSTRPEMGYTLYYNPDTADIVPLKDYNPADIIKNKESELYKDNPDLISKGYVPVRPGFRNGKLHRWRWGLDTFKERIEEVEIKENGNNFKAVFKQQGFNAPKNLWKYSVGTIETKELFNGQKVFDYPKSTKFLKYILKISTERKDIVLDFFSGSASTAHAVMQLNAEDNGNRKHIQVQLPERTDKNSEAYKAGYKTLTEIGKERIRRAAKKIAEEDPEKAKDLDLGFKVFKLDTSNVKAWDGSIKEENGEKKDVKQMVMEMESNIKEDRNEKDVLYEILLKYGLDLTLPIEEKEIAGKKVYNVGMGAIFLCLGVNIPPAIAEGIGKWKEELEPEICRVIFRDSGFGSDADKTNISQTLKRFGIEEVRSI